MSRSTVLDRLRRVAKPQQAGPLPQALPDFPSFPDPVQQFKIELERVAGVFLDGRTPALLGTSLERVLRDAQAQEILWENEFLFRKHALEFRLRDPEAFAKGLLVYSQHPEQRVTFPLVLTSRPYSRTALAETKVSASSAAAGVAETGTVVEKTGPGAGRLLTVLPPIHVSLLSERDMLMNQAELFSRMQLGETESYKVLVTGPSRTADIERTLVLGVHGPQRHYVVLTP